MNLQEQIANELSEKMCSAMDFEILADVLCRFGWHKVELERFKNNRQAVDISYWCESNVRGQWSHNGRHFIFEQMGDAVNFILKWKA